MSTIINSLVFSGICRRKHIQNGSVLLWLIFLLLSIMSYTAMGEGKIRIACVGNSITFGAGIANREVDSYPAQLGTLLGENYEVRNFGVSGTTLLSRGNAPYIKTQAYKQALSFNPDWVFIKLGTNDSKPENRVYLNEYIQDYKELIESFRQSTNHPRIILLLPVPVFSTDTTGITASVVGDKIIPMIRQVAYDTGCEVINLYNLLIESPELFPDKVHPNCAGASVIAKRISELVLMKPGSSVDISGALPRDAKTFNFYGFRGYDFTFSGRNAKVVVPRQSVPGHPWVWRARFWGHEPQTDIALLERGFHIVYCDVAELFGNKEALLVWNKYYHMLTRVGLAKKAVMEGMSRGGVYVYRWVAAYPKRVAAVYADAPVLDLKSWPGGKKQSKGSPSDWEKFKKDFGFTTEEEAIGFKGNPLDLAGKIARSKIPMLHVVGDADDVVPVAENTALFEQKIKEAGGSIKIIHKPGVGHHPHSLLNPKPIIDFILGSYQ